MSQMLRKALFLCVILACLSSGSSAQRQMLELRKNLSDEIAPFKGTVGIAVWFEDQGDTLNMNNDVKYPLLSVYKLPLAMKVMHDIDSGLYNLNSKVEVSAEELSENTYSPMKKQLGDTGFSADVETLLKYAVAYSDNIACDVLFRLAGGPQAVNTFIRNLGVSGINIQSTEKQMHRKPELAYQNYGTPLELNRLLRLLYRGEILTLSSTEKLMDIMTSNQTGAQRLMKWMPSEVKVAHKTGTGTNGEMVMACNDVGIITLPDGRKILLSVLIKDTYEPYENCEALIAGISRICYQHFLR